MNQEWQCLTDDEIKEIVGSNGDGIGGYTRELFDKIEAKIREKNEPTETPQATNGDEPDVAGGVYPSDTTG